ncbi:MAG: polymerase beta subunit, N-terminal domain, partial [Solirubrobacterales bacterium]|nr:polymerase beta subunit, N-terminal domain [Solirubrobacterales bacterium]
MEIETAAETESGMTSSGTSGTGMKINVTRDELVAKLGVVSRAVSTRGTVQVLAGILLTAEPDATTLAATDMELSLRTTLDAQVDG